MWARRLAPVLALSLCVSGLAQPSSAKSLPPKDECSADPTLRGFVQRLQAAVAKRDAAALLAMMDSKILSDFGGGEGLSYFKAKWHLERGAKSPLWAELDTLIALGCARDPKFAAFPYLYVRAPVGGEGEDAFETYVAKGAAIPVRGSASPKAPEIAKLNWDVVTSKDYDGQGAWMKITTPGGKSGFVLARDMRSVVDYRLIIEQKNQQWRITALVAGD